jgi:hypothetical protein
MVKLVLLLLFPALLGNHWNDGRPNMNDDPDTGWYESVNSTLVNEYNLELASVTTAASHRSDGSVSTSTIVSCSYEKPDGSEEYSQTKTFRGNDIEATHMKGKSWAEAHCFEDHD